MQTTRQLSQDSTLVLATFLLPFTESFLWALQRLGRISMNHLAAMDPFLSRH